MGNRAVLKFKNSDNSYSKTGIYLHWNGGKASIEGFLLASKTLFNTKRVSDDYKIARLTQIIANFFGGMFSIGVGDLDTLDQNNNDNGVYVIDSDFNIIDREFNKCDEEIDEQKTLEIAIDCIEKNLSIFYDNQEEQGICKNKLQELRDTLQNFKNKEELI
jgi:hypothetical protein